ncbi:helix-turn-helix domain-containing protein [Kineococcus radiotolerans]|nr:helix-turn-helix domain-containing protein [Kineococcus radiotolerans]
MSDDFPSRVRRARERLMLDRKEFAQLLKVSEKTVQNWELGKSLPRNRMGALEQYLEPSAPALDPLAAIEQRVRDSGLFAGDALDKAIQLAKEAYIADHAPESVDHHHQSPRAQRGA